MTVPSWGNQEIAGECGGPNLTSVGLQRNAVEFAYHAGADGALYLKHIAPSGWGGHALPGYIDNSNHWRERAQEARHLAEQERDPLCKRMILQIAEDYDRLARQAALRMESRSSGSKSPAG
jgi:hypothetical protein